MKWMNTKWKFQTRLESKYNWSDPIASPRRHAGKDIKAVKPVIAQEFREELPRYNELRVVSNDNSITTF